MLYGKGHFWLVLHKNNDRCFLINLFFLGAIYNIENVFHQQNDTTLRRFCATYKAWTPYFIILTYTFNRSTRSPFRLDCSPIVLNNLTKTQFHKIESTCMVENWSVNNMDDNLFVIFLSQRMC